MSKLNSKTLTIAAVVLLVLALLFVATPLLRVAALPAAPVLTGSPGVKPSRADRTVSVSRARVTVPRARAYRSEQRLKPGHHDQPCPAVYRGRKQPAASQLPERHRRDDRLRPGAAGLAGRRGGHVPYQALGTDPRHRHGCHLPAAVAGQLPPPDSSWDLRAALNVLSLGLGILHLVAGDRGHRPGRDPGEEDDWRSPRRPPSTHHRLPAHNFR